MTGLLLIYPSCVLHIIESSREVLLRVLKDLKDLQQHPTRAMLKDSKVVFLVQNPLGRLFQQWSYKVIDAGQTLQALEEENTESLVCTVLSALQELETTKHIPESWEFILSQELVLKLLGRDDLLSPEEHLQTFDSPLNIRVDFGQVSRSQFINRV
ncbi:unnamed protein product [Tetraodon nigroviridis]|uniref:(spotted green pufferfish) hypothetical protein n=1 Tax=Tetraodon nigroviridis TaxID=99883 RepID=Q4S8M9_TETNG|nr:unnamed protein product [Tetraodon nigroviridis]